jgi:hypothetical protein
MRSRPPFPPAPVTPGAAPEPTEDLSSASAAPDATDRTSDMNDAHSPRLLDQPLQLRSTLQLSSHARTDAAGADPASAAALAEALTVRIDLDQAVVNRLFELWNTLLLVEADELGDWSISAQAAISHSLINPIPPLLGVGATVYASGEAALALMVEGIDVPLWFAEQIDLHDLERTQPGTNHLSLHGAAS